MIENLQYELYQLENKQAKLPKECFKTSFEVLERHNMQNQTIFELHLLII